MKKIALLLISVASLWLAQANEFFLQGSPFIGFFTYVPLMYLIAQLRNFRDAKKYGMIYGVLFTLASYFWLLNFGDFAIWTLSGVALVYFLYFAAFFQMLWWVQKKETKYRVVLLSIIWLLFEYFRSSGYLAFPWNLAAHPFHSDLAFIQSAEIGGVWIVSWLVLLTQVSISELLLVYFPGRFKKEKTDLRSRYRVNYSLDAKLTGTEEKSFPSQFKILISDYPIRALYVSLILLLANYIFGGITLANESVMQKSEPKSLDLVLVQQNRDSWRGGSFTEILEELIDISDDHRTKETDFIIWSETSLRLDYERNEDYFLQIPRGRSLRSWLRDHEIPLLTGAPVVTSREPYIAHNGAQLIQEGVAPVQWYGKLHLIPFAEHVPFRDFAPLGDFLENVIGIGRFGWSYGPGYTQFTFDIASPSGELQTTQFGTPICFEDSFPEICRNMVLGGSEILINLTNNAWSKTLSAQMQHFIAAKFRSIENRRPLVRSTNGGLTGIILPSGELQSSIPMFTQDALVDTLRFGSQRFTSYTLLGDYVIWLAALLFFVIKSPRWIQSIRRGRVLFKKPIN